LPSERQFTRLRTLFFSVVRTGFTNKRRRRGMIEPTFRHHCVACLRRRNRSSTTTTMRTKLLLVGLLTALLIVGILRHRSMVPPLYGYDRISVSVR
jgi:hypothetical protein